MSSPHRSSEKRRQDDLDHSHERRNRRRHDDDRDRDRDHGHGHDHNRTHHHDHHHRSSASSSSSSSHRRRSHSRGEERDRDERRSGHDNRSAGNRDHASENEDRRESARTYPADRDPRPSSNRPTKGDSWRPDQRNKDHTETATSSSSGDKRQDDRSKPQHTETSRHVVQIKGIYDASHGMDQEKRPRSPPPSSPPSKDRISRPARPHIVFAAARAAAQDVAAPDSRFEKRRHSMRAGERGQKRDTAEEGEVQESGQEVSHHSSNGDRHLPPDAESRSHRERSERNGHPSHEDRQNAQMDTYRPVRSSKVVSPPHERRREQPNTEGRPADHWVKPDSRSYSRSPPDRRSSHRSDPSRRVPENERGYRHRTDRDSVRGDNLSGDDSRHMDSYRPRVRDSRRDERSISIKGSSAQETEARPRRSPSVESGQISPPRKLRRLPGASVDDVDTGSASQASSTETTAMSRTTRDRQDEGSRAAQAKTTATAPLQTSTQEILDEPKVLSRRDVVALSALPARHTMVPDEAASASSPQAMPPRTSPEPIPPPPIVEKQESAAIRRRREIRARLKPLQERVFVGCSEASAYEKVDESKGGLLGMGTFGEVSRARQISTGLDVALKKIKIQANESHNGMPITAIREIKLLKKLSHPNVCPVVDMVYEAPSETSTGSGTVYMVLPYMEHDLNGLIERLDSEDKPFTPAQIKLYAKQLFEGTLYLHQNKILHRDIKAANILISNDGSLRIADFGLARPYHDPGALSGRPAWRMNEKGQPGWEGGTVNYTGMVVTRWYRPPELLAGERRYGPAVDMWGLGCLLAEMIIRRPVFKGSSEINQLELIVDLCGSPGEDCYPGWKSLPGVKNVDNTGQTKADKNEKGRHDFGQKARCVREKFMGMVRSELADLIDRLLVLDPRKRLTAEGALAHKWFDVEPLPADPASLPQYPESKEATKGQRGPNAHRKPMGHAQQPLPRLGMGGPGSQPPPFVNAAAHAMGYPPNLMGMRPNGMPGMGMGMPQVNVASVVGPGVKGGGTGPGQHRGPSFHGSGPYGGNMHMHNHVRPPGPQYPMMGDMNGAGGGPGMRGGHPGWGSGDHRGYPHAGPGTNPYRRNGGSDWGGGGGGGGGGGY